MNNAEPLKLAVYSRKSSERQRPAGIEFARTALHGRKTLQ